MSDQFAFKLVMGSAVFMVGVISEIWFIENSASSFSFLRDLPTIDECVDATFDEKTVDTLTLRLPYCYDKVYLQSQLNEFTIRRLVFQSQYISDLVLLWMVVFITLAGVILSGLQLFTSYQLAKGGHTIEEPIEFSADQGGKPSVAAGSSLVIEKGKIALRSSVTGLFILIISFAFFMFS